MNKTAIRTGSEGPYNPRKVLLSKKAEFLEALGINSHRLAGAARELDADPVQILQEESLHLGLNGVLYGQLRQVEEALERLKQGEYGYCRACNDPIATNRLRSVPWTEYCLGCQEKISALALGEECSVGERN